MNIEFDVFMDDESECQSESQMAASIASCHRPLNAPIDDVHVLKLSGDG